MPHGRRSFFGLRLIAPFRDALSFRGRARRGELLAFMLVSQLMCALVARILADPFAPPPPALVAWYLVWTIPMPAMFVRRLHDAGLSGWWDLVVLLHPAATLAASQLPQSPGGGSMRLLWLSASPAPGPAAALLSLLAMAGILGALLFTMIPGDDRANRFGKDPRAATA